VAGGRRTGAEHTSSRWYSLLIGAAVFVVAVVVKQVVGSISWLAVVLVTSGAVVDAMIADRVQAHRRRARSRSSSRTIHHP